MKKNTLFFKKFGTMVLASSLMVSGFPQLQLTQAAAKFSMEDKVTIGKGETYELNTNKSLKISFRSSNKKIVTVTKAGKIKGKKVGKASITAKLNKQVKRCKVTVKPAPKSISFNQEKITLVPGEKQTLTVSFSSGYSKKITYKTENSDVANVSGNGVVFAKKAGETLITAKAFNGKKAVLRCVVEENNTPVPTNDTEHLSTNVPAVENTKLPVEVTMVPSVTEDAAISTMEPTQTPVATEDVTPTPVQSTIVPSLVPATEIPATATPSVAPATEIPATATPSAIPVTEVPATATPSVLPATEVPATATPSAIPVTALPATEEPTATPIPTPLLVATAIPGSQTVKFSAIVSDINCGTIYVNDNTTVLQLTSCVTYHKTCYDGTTYEVTQDEIIPGDRIEITATGVLTTDCYPYIMMQCEMIVAKNPTANAIIEDKLKSVQDGNTLKFVNHKDTTFYINEHTKILENGQEIGVEQLKEDTVVRVCGYNFTLEGPPPAIDSYVGYAKTVVVLGKSVLGLEKDTDYLVDEYTVSFKDDPEKNSLWRTGKDAYYLVTKDTLVEIIERDGTISYRNFDIEDKLPLTGRTITFYYEPLPEEIATGFEAKNKIVRITFKAPYDLDDGPLRPKKPVIYLYPEEKTEVSVDLDFDGTLTYTYPYSADGHWNVIANPDGTLVNKEDGLEYSYIFWEGITEHFKPDFSKGFCVKGEDTTKFLQSILPKTGMTPKEYNEFIVYWAPLMQENPYNLISFQTENYEANAPLTIQPAPDSILRVYMAYKPLTKPVVVEPQTFEPFVRNGFTVVEWGGCVVNP